MLTEAQYKKLAGPKPDTYEEYVAQQKEWNIKLNGKPNFEGFDDKLAYPSKAAEARNREKALVGPYWDLCARLLQDHEWSDKAKEMKLHLYVEQIIRGIANYKALSNMGLKAPQTKTRRYNEQVLEEIKKYIREFPEGEELEEDWKLVYDVELRKGCPVRGCSRPPTPGVFVSQPNFGGEVFCADAKPMPRGSSRKGVTIL